MFLEVLGVRHSLPLDASALVSRPFRLIDASFLSLRFVSATRSPMVQIAPSVRTKFRADAEAY